MKASGCVEFQFSSERTDFENEKSQKKELN